MQEELVAKAARELWKDKSRGTVKSTEWSESDGLLMFRSKIYVPNDRDLRHCIIEQHHDTRIAGHAGRFKTLELLGIKLAMSTAYHPQTDGQMERVNQVLEGYLRIFTSRRQDDWDDFLPTGEFQYNNTVHLSTQQTPFMVDTGRHPRMGFEPQQPRSTLESVNEFAERMALGIEEAKAALTKAKDEYSMYYNCRREPALVFAPGDRVWLDGSDIATNRPSSKLSH
jgi:transposase InsO family protein